MADPYRVLTLNNISARGLERLPRERYEVAPDLNQERAHRERIQVARRPMPLGRTLRQPDQIQADPDRTAARLAHRTTPAEAITPAEATHLADRTPPAEATHLAEVTHPGTADSDGSRRTTTRGTLMPVRQGVSRLGI